MTFTERQFLIIILSLIAFVIDKLKLWRSKNSIWIFYDSFFLCFVWNVLHLYVNESSDEFFKGKFLDHLPALLSGVLTLFSRLIYKWMILNFFMNTFAIRELNFQAIIKIYNHIMTLFYFLLLSHQYVTSNCTHTI